MELFSRIKALNKSNVKYKYTSYINIKKLSINGTFSFNDTTIRYYLIW